MKRVVGFVIVALLCGFLPGTLVYAEIAENQGLFHRQIKLYTGDAQDSYLLVFPVEVTQPGRVECEFKLLRPDEERYQRALEKIRQERGKAFMFRWSLVDSRFFDQKKPMEPGKFQQWLQEANNYNPVEYLAGDQIRGMVRGAKAALDFVFGKKKKKQAPVYLHGYSQSVRFPHTPDNHVTTGRMRHDIDFNELAQTQGMYFLVLENFSQLTPELEVKVSFPGKQHQVDKDFLLPRDLGITALQVHGDHVYVEVQNLGEASLPQELYTRKGKDAATLMLWLDGKSWGGRYPGETGSGKKSARTGWQGRLYLQGRGGRQLRSCFEAHSAEIRGCRCRQQRKKTASQGLAEGPDPHQGVAALICVTRDSERSVASGDLTRVLPRAVCVKAPARWKYRAPELFVWRGPGRSRAIHDHHFAVDMQGLLT